MATLHYGIIPLILAVVLVTPCAFAFSPDMPAKNIHPVVGTMVRFIAGSTAVDVTIDQDNPPSATSFRCCRLP